jgi:hypothetical protein
MDQTASLFAKWQRWIEDLKRPFHDLIIFKRIADGFVNSLLPHEGKARKPNDVQLWMLINYVERTASAIRRLSDYDKRNNVVSLRNLLENMKTSAVVITPNNVSKYCPHITIDGKPTMTVKDALDGDIALIRSQTKPVHNFVDTMIAHDDPKSSAIIPAGLHDLDIAIDMLHKVYRKWAKFLTGLPCNLDDPNPIDMLIGEPPEYEPQFRAMWNALDQPSDVRILISKPDHEHGDTRTT